MLSAADSASWNWFHSAEAACLEKELIDFELTDDLDGGKRDLEVDIWYELDDEAQELLGVGEEVQFSVCRQDWHELVLNDLNGIGTFLKEVKAEVIPSINCFHSERQ